MVLSMIGKYWGVQRTFVKSEETQRHEERIYQSSRAQFKVEGEVGGSWLVGSCGPDPGHLDEVIDPYIEHALVSDLIYAMLGPVAGATIISGVDDRGPNPIKS